MGKTEAFAEGKTDNAGRVKQSKQNKAFILGPGLARGHKGGFAEDFVTSGPKGNITWRV